jgi:excisionase family DNA binding protein
LSEATVPPLPELLDITELAKHLRVNARHIRRLVYERRIPYIKWGHLIRFDPDEIRAWLNANRSPLGGRPPLGPTRPPVPSTPRRRPAQAEPEGSKSLDQDQLPGRWPPDRKEKP